MVYICHALIDVVSGAARGQAGAALSGDGDDDDGRRDVYICVV